MSSTHYAVFLLVRNATAYSVKSSVKAHSNRLHFLMWTAADRCISAEFYIYSGCSGLRHTIQLIVASLNEPWDRKVDVFVCLNLNMKSVLIRKKVLWNSSIRESWDSRLKQEARRWDCVKEGYLSSESKFGVNAVKQLLSPHRKASVWCTVLFEIKLN